MELFRVIFSTKNGVVVLAKPPALLGYCIFYCNSELINESMTTTAKIMRDMKHTACTIFWLLHTA
jgi:hypothetical protein